MAKAWGFAARGIGGSGAEDRTHRSRAGRTSLDNTNDRAILWVMGRGADTRQVILGRAAQVASLVGLEGLTIGGLAEELQLSKSGLFAHFHSKEALQVDTLRFAAQLFIDSVIRPALKSRRGEPRVRALFER